MSDFHQTSTITTLHNLTKRPVAEIEAELMRFAQVRPITLILPSLFSELEGDALPHIVKVLADVPYLEEIIIGLDRANRKEFEHAKQFFSPLKQHHRILWNDGPRLRAIHDRLAAQDLAPTEAGKGRNVWYCMGYAKMSGLGDVLALHDCDITTYDAGLLARLVYPVANPSLSYSFAKGYYARVANGSLNGRVSRLLVAPFLEALEMTIGQHPYTRFLASFRYPLSGEFAMRMGVVPDVRIPTDWGLEIGFLSEMRRNTGQRAICQVDIADIYDHKHQELSAEDASKGLSRMSVDIVKAILRKLATEGMVFSVGSLRTLRAAYYRCALDMIESYASDAAINGLHLDRHKEEQAVELFAANILHAGDIFLENPSETPFIPNWRRISSAFPDIRREFLTAVEEDNAP